MPLLLFLIYSFSLVTMADELVTINNTVQNITRKTKCSKITDNSSDFCDCCLIKEQAKGHNAVFALGRCSKKFLCFKLDKQEDAEQIIEKAKSRLRHFSVLDLGGLEHNPSLPLDGYLEDNHIFSIIKSLSEEGYLLFPLDIFKEKNEALCFRAKSLGDSAKGINSGQLFAIFYNIQCSDKNLKSAKWKGIYILKETKKGLKELKNLYKVTQSKLGKEKIASNLLLLDKQNNSHNKIAHITFEDVNFKFFARGHWRYFSFLQMAPGKSLSSHLKSFGEFLKKSSNKENNIAEINSLSSTFFDIGFAMSKLHQKYAIDQDNDIFGKTFIHGDFHAQNVFYEEKNRTVSLIDNETFALSFPRPSSGINDIIDLYLLHSVKTIAHKFTDQLLVNEEFGISDEIWHHLWAKLFHGYLLAYEGLSKERLLKALEIFRAKFHRGLFSIHLFDRAHNLKDQRKLKRFSLSPRLIALRHKLLKIFEELKEDIINNTCIK
jgi:hypothetical protein